MTKAIANFRAEKLWRTIPQNIQQDILASVWCASRRQGRPISSWQLGIINDSVVIEGTCSSCGGPCARRLEED